MLVVVCAVVALVSLWLLLRRPKHAVDQLPGPPTVPVFGNVLAFAVPREQGFQNFRRFAAQYWPLYRTWQTNIPVIHPLDPSYVEAVLASSEHITKSHDYFFIKPWLGTGLLTSTGAKWRRHRKMLTPAFHFSILEQFVPMICDKTQILIRKLRTHQGRPEGVNITSLLTYCALDVICETAMGTSVNAQEDSESEYVKAIHEINDLIVHRIMRPWLYLPWLYRLTSWGRRHDHCLSVLHGFTNRVIRERREELWISKTDKAKWSSTNVNDDGDIGIKKKFAFLDLLLRVSEEGEGALTDEDIREEVDTFMFEGHDTTAMAMSWALFFLGANPDVQSHCVSELGEIFGGSDRAPTMADLAAMKYLERVIKETLRLRPSVALISRRLEHNLNLEGYDEFPAGTKIQIHIYDIHRNPEIYPDPERFDPDRFLPENCVGRHPYAYIPFSAGPRNCIGQKFAMLEEKTVVSSVLRHFRLETLDPEHHYQYVPDLILRPKFGLQMRLTPRALGCKM